METYIIAVKREHRDEAQDDWASVLDEVEGVEPQADQLRPDRRQVHATSSGIEEVKKRLGDLCHIEEVISHRPLSVTPEGLGSSSSEEDT